MRSKNCLVLLNSIESQDCKYNGLSCLANLEKEIIHQMRTGIVDDGYILSYCDPTQRYSDVKWVFFKAYLIFFFFSSSTGKGKANK